MENSLNLWSVTTPGLSSGQQSVLSKRGDLGQWPVELPPSFMYLVGSGVVTTAKPVRW